MSRKQHRTLPRSVWVAFAFMCALGVPTGLLGGSESISEFVFGVGVYAVPTAFIVWAVIRLDPRGLGEITGADRWRDNRQRRDEEIERLARQRAQQRAAE